MNNKCTSPLSPKYFQSRRSPAHLSAHSLSFLRSPPPAFIMPPRDKGEDTNQYQLFLARDRVPKLQETFYKMQTNTQTHPSKVLSLLLLTQRAFPLPSWSLSLSLSLYLLLRGWRLVWIFKIQQAEYTFKKALCSGFSSRQNLYPSLKIKSCCKL